MKTDIAGTASGQFKISVVMKHAGNITKKVSGHPFIIGRRPDTLRELIEESVKSCIELYRERAALSENPLPLTEDEYRGMEEIGKFAFGISYGNTDIDTDKAVKTAMDAFTDGLVRIFRGNEELKDPDEALDVREGEVFTFVKLTMLSGRMW